MPSTSPTDKQRTARPHVGAKGRAVQASGSLKGYLARRTNLSARTAFLFRRLKSWRCEPFHQMLAHIHLPHFSEKRIALWTWGHMPSLLFELIGSARHAYLERRPAHSLFLRDPLARLDRVKHNPISKIRVPYFSFRGSSRSAACSPLNWLENISACASSANINTDSSLRAAATCGHAATEIVPALHRNLAVQRSFRRCTALRVARPSKAEATRTKVVRSSNATCCNSACELTFSCGVTPG